MNRGAATPPFLVEEKPCGGLGSEVAVVNEVSVRYETGEKFVDRFQANDFRQC